MSPNESLAGRPAVFLDRDGTLMPDVEYCRDPAQVKVFPGARKALQKMHEAEFLLVVITNQSGIGRGYFSETEYRAVAAELERQLGDALIAATYFCPDRPEQPTARRKPGVGMILEAQRDLGIDLARSFMIGDKAIDVECGRNAGLRTILVQTGQSKAGDATGADWSTRDLTEAAEIVIRHAR
ncbi:MAG: D-glycero-alpha-D-manno-heptose-1,7-bisphosphate 7-phosphatase [Chthoniobacterales bacterium]